MPVSKRHIRRRKNKDNVKNLVSRRKMRVQERLQAKKQEFQEYIAEQQKIQAAYREKVNSEYINKEKDNEGNEENGTDDNLVVGEIKEELKEVNKESNKEDNNTNNNEDENDDRD